GLGKLNGKQVEDGVFSCRIDATAFTAVDPLETQRRLAAPQLGPAPFRRRPVETAKRNDQTFFLGSPDNIRDLDQGILQMGGYDLDIVSVEGNELQRLHDARSLPSLRSRPALSPRGRRIRACSGKVGP